ncbi:MAG: hypothetical protein L0Z62_09325 [Gemmataceae bacterium]|nr:hypothetical protein [Gemmataceae bacterium]
MLKPGGMPTSILVRMFAIIAVLLALPAGLPGAPPRERSFTHFESFETALENTADDPRDINHNGIIDCGSDDNCSTITSCADSPALCDEWTLPLGTDPDLRLANEAPGRNAVYFKSASGGTFPPARGRAEVVAPGSKLLCPEDRDNGILVDGVRADHMDFHIHTVKTPDIDGTDTSKPGSLPKAFRGQNSLHFGRHIKVGKSNFPGKENTFGDTYVLETINAFIIDREGGLNLNTAPTREQPLRLSFWHIAELCDYECFEGFLPDTSDDLGIVEVRADQDPGAGVVWGTWERVEPTLNPYDSLQDTLYSTPTYEPPDDINPLGTTDRETTMCFPLTAWASQGSAKGVDAANCGDGDGNSYSDCGESDGPVARGQAGLGVWALSTVNLERYAGKHVQVRFIVTTLDSDDIFISYLEPLVVPYAPPTASWDDGWYIDDIRVSGLVAGAQ